MNMSMFQIYYLTSAFILVAMMSWARSSNRAQSWGPSIRGFAIITASILWPSLLLFIACFCIGKLTETKSVSWRVQT